MILQMARWWTTPEADPSFLQFRERSVRDGAWLTYVVALVVAGYAFATWDRPNRTQILVLLGVAVFGAYVLSRLPAPAIVRSRWREPFFLAWTTADVALIALVVASDGGDWSPLRATFFLPLIFAALSYPPRSVAATGALSVLGVPRRRAARRPRDGRDARRLLRDPDHRDGHGRLPGRQPRAPARRAADALALGPADGRAQPPRLHRALRGRALRPHAPRRPSARADRPRPRQLQARQRHARARGRRRPPVRGGCRARCRPAPLRRARPPRRRRVRGPAPRSRPGRAARRRGAARAAARRRRRRVDRHSPPSRSTASAPRTCTAPRTPTSTAPRRGGPSGSPTRSPDRRPAPSRSPSAGPRRCPRRW